MKNSWISLAAVCALVIGVYAYTAHSGFVVSAGLNASDNYYNLLVQGFRAGQLNLKIDVPPGLGQLANPYDPMASAAYPVADMSYYKGKLYLYFGVTPALVLFWPYVALTGHYLLQKDAAVIFCLIGFLASAGLLYALWRRYFPEVNVAVVAAGMLALGLATGVPLILARCDVYEVLIGCGYALMMLALAAIWQSLHHSSHRACWLAAASLAYGLALGSRPSLLFGSIVLFVPVAQAWGERRQVLRLLVAAMGPILLIGLGLMLYNEWRFDNPLEFGWRYQVGDRQLTRQSFSLRYLWFNFRLYFLSSAGWSSRFPFVLDAKVPPLPAGYGRVEQTFGVLTNIPLVWLALAVPLAWRSGSAEVRRSLRRFLAVVAVLAGIVVLTLCLFCAACARYEVEFLPAWVLLAVIGVLSLERALACRPLWRRPVRWGWGLLLTFSIAFNLLTSIERCVEAHNNLGTVLRGAGQIQEALRQYTQALRLTPENAQVQYNLGLTLAQLGRLQEAIGQYEQALRLKPDFAEAHNDLGVALMSQGRLEKAIGQYEQALRLKPDFAKAQYNLGNGFLETGRLQEAIGQYEQALRLKPDFAEAHFNLAVALENTGRTREALDHYRQALKLRPDFAPAGNAVARLQAGQ